MAQADIEPFDSLKYVSIRLVNFLSFKSSTLDLGNFTALVGPNSSGKSNAVAGIKLLRDIPIHGLPIAIARRGGFDQLRHRSAGRPNDPAIRLNFTFDGSTVSYYELKLGARKGKQYEVKREEGVVHVRGTTHTFVRTRDEATFHTKRANGDATLTNKVTRIPPGQSIVQFGLSEAAHIVTEVLSLTQTVEVNPSRLAELQEPSSTREFEPDGSNLVSILELLDADRKQQLIDYIQAIVPGIETYKIEHFADKVTVMFTQDEGEHGQRSFLAKQMSDGTLRTFAIFVAMLQPERPKLLVIEEPEVAIHLGALQTLIQSIKDYASDCQVLITTHSADIIDSVDLDSVRVVWSENGESRVAPIAEHTRGPVLQGLITPGALLRADALDPAVA